MRHKKKYQILVEKCTLLQMWSFTYIGVLIDLVDFLKVTGLIGGMEPKIVKEKSVKGTWKSWSRGNEVQCGGEDIKW